MAETVADDVGDAVAEAVAEEEDVAVCVEALCVEDEVPVAEAVGEAVADADAVADDDAVCDNEQDALSVKEGETEADKLPAGLLDGSCVCEAAADLERLGVAEGDFEAAPLTDAADDDDLERVAVTLAVPLTVDELKPDAVTIAVALPVLDTESDPDFEVLGVGVEVPVVEGDADNELERLGVLLGARLADVVIVHVGEPLDDGLGESLRVGVADADRLGLFDAINV